MILGLALNSIAGAAVINVDFQGGGSPTTSTSGALQPTGGVWNVNGSGYGVEVPLVDSLGTPVSVMLWTDGFTGTLPEGDALYSDYLSGQLELRGLEPNQSYDLALYSAANLLTLFELPGPWTLSPASANPPDSPYISPDLPGIEGHHYVTGVAQADALGTIAIFANRGAIAGLQIDPAPISNNPEPSVLLLNGLALSIGLLRRRRR